MHQIRSNVLAHKSPAGIARYNERVSKRKYASRVLAARRVRLGVSR